MGNDHQMYPYDFVRDMLTDICIEVKRSVQVLHHHVLGWGSDDVDNEGGGHSGLHLPFLKSQVFGGGLGQIDNVAFCSNNTLKI